MATYDTDKLNGALARALMPQNVLQRTAAGTPATEADFHRIHEEACTLLLLQPQLAYWFAHRATNVARAHLRQTVATLEDLIVSLVDAMTPSVPVSSTEALSSALQYLETAEQAAALGGTTRSAKHAMTRALSEIDAFSRELVPNVAPRVGDRTADTAYAIGEEARATALAQMGVLDKQYKRLMDLLVSLRSSVPQFSTESLRGQISDSLLQRATAAVAGAVDYYDRTPPEDAVRVSSAVLANLQAISAGVQLVDQARSPLVPKVLSPRLQLDDAGGRPGGSSYHLVPAGTPEPLTAVLTPVGGLPVGAALVYSRDGAPDTTVPIPGAGLFSLLGSTDLSTVTVPNPTDLYVDFGGVITTIPLTPGNQTIAQVVADINAVIPGFASQLGGTGRLLLSSAAGFSLVTTYTADAVPAVTSDAIPLPSGTNWQGTVLQVVVSDSTGVHYQQHTFPNPFIPNNIAAVVAELNVAAFTDAGGAPVLAVSNNGNSLVLSAVESGDVTITVSGLSTVVTGGHLPWTALSAYGRSTQGSSGASLLGFTTLEATTQTDPQEIVDAINDADSTLTASLSATGDITLQADSPTLASSIEVKASTGATELGATPALTRASTTSVEVRGVAADGSAEETPDHTTLGVQVGDRVRISSGNEEFDVSISSLAGGRIGVDAGVPGDIGVSDVRIDDGALQQFESLDRALTQVNTSRLSVRSPAELRAFHLQWMERLTGRELNPGVVKKAVEVYVGLLNVLTHTLEDQARVADRLALLALSWSPVSPTVEDGLEENSSPPWAPGIADAGKSMLQSFEERGYDRAVELLDEGRLRAFVALTPLQASRAGRVEGALYESVEAMRSRVP